MLLTTLVFFVSCVFPEAIAQDCPSGCVCDTPSGRIDLTSLVNLGEESSFQGNDGKFNYYYTPCGYPVKAYCYNEAAVCQVNPDNGNSFSTGPTSSEQIMVEGDSLFIQYSGGDGGRMSKIQLICDESGTNTFTALGEPYELEYDFELRSKCACYGGCEGGDPPRADPPSNDNDGTPAGIIGIVLIVLAVVSIMAYFIIGGIILHQKYQTIGKDLVPQRNFWLSLPLLVKDGFIFTSRPIVNMIKSRIGRGSGSDSGSYETLK